MIGNAAIQAALAAYSIEEECLREMKATADPTAISGTVELLCAAPRIAASGCGHSGIAARHFAHLMCCMERPARFLSPSEATHGGMGFLQENDVLVLVSRGGQTEELLPLAEICIQRRAKLITVTENPDSPLARLADLTLLLRVNRETDRDNAQGTTSMTATCALFHALQAALIEETGYTADRFAGIHPGGAVGKRLSGQKEV